MIKNQAFNPYLPKDVYIPDGEPYVFGNRLYVYGSHDLEGGEDFCLLDYVCYSAPIDDLSAWRFEGTIYKKTDDPSNQDGACKLFAPDVCQGPDGRYYLYYCLNGKGLISVAVCDTPADTYKYHGTIQYKNGNPLIENIPFDPAIYQENGQIYLYYGFSPTCINIEEFEGKDLPGCSVVKLDQDMLGVIEGPKVVIPSEQYSNGTTFEGHEYFEAPSIRRVGNTYYLIYSSILFHELCYATSLYPDREFTYGGTVVSNGDIGFEGRAKENKVNHIGNNHGGMVNVKDQWYIFYHRHTHGSQYSRQGCAEPIEIQKNGTINQVEITSCGLNNGPLSCDEIYPATICCHLTTEQTKSKTVYDEPYIICEEDERFITHVVDGSKIGYKYFDVDKEALIVGIEYRSKGRGSMLVSTSEQGKAIGASEILKSSHWVWTYTSVPVGKGVHGIYFQYEGKGFVEVRNFSIMSK